MFKSFDSAPPPPHPKTLNWLLRYFCFTKDNQGVTLNEFGLSNLYICRNYCHSYQFQASLHWTLSHFIAVTRNAARSLPLSSLAPASVSSLLNMLIRKLWMDTFIPRQMPKELRSLNTTPTPAPTHRQSTGKQWQWDSEVDWCSLSHCFPAVSKLGRSPRSLCLSLSLIANHCLQTLYEKWHVGALCICCCMCTFVLCILWFYLSAEVKSFFNWKKKCKSLLKMCSSNFKRVSHSCSFFFV